MTKTGRADYLIKEAGCGSFQVLIVVFANILPKMSAIYAILFMAFGNYNPGWRCLDNNNTNNNNSTTSYFYNETLTNLSDKSVSQDGKTPEIIHIIDATRNDNETFNDFFYSEGSCEIFSNCRNIQFDPDTSTLVTEWGLLCKDDWVPPLMISMQMTGALLGSLIAGQLGDSFGRKKTLYIPLFITGVLNIIALFSTYWQIYIAIRFLIGLMFSSIFNSYNLYPAEFLHAKWRARVAAFPSWQVGGFLFGISAMVFKDWRIIHITTAAFMFASCLSVVWVPESLRWLEVTNKQEEFQKVAKKMLAGNKITISLDSSYHLNLTQNEQPADDTKVRSIYTVLDLFRKGYRFYTFTVGFVWFSCMFVFYGISYGVKAMYGHFYINLIIIFAADVPYSILTMHLPNLIGRKKATLFFNTVAAISLLVATGFVLLASTTIRSTGSLILALITKMNVSASPGTCLVLTTELFPTVVRSNAMGYLNFMARIGGIIAPVVIPKDSNDLYLCYGAMGALCLLCSICILKLPETKGTKIKEVFDEN